MFKSLLVFVALLAVVYSNEPTHNNSPTSPAVGAAVNSMPSNSSNQNGQVGQSGSSSQNEHSLSSGQSAPSGNSIVSDHMQAKVGDVVLNDPINVVKTFLENSLAILKNMTTSSSQKQTGPQEHSGNAEGNPSMGSTTRPTTARH